MSPEVVTISATVLFIILVGLLIVGLTREHKHQISSTSFGFSIIGEGDADDMYFESSYRSILYYDAKNPGYYFLDPDLSMPPFDGFYTDGKIMLIIKDGQQEIKQVA